jgi:competence protein ComEC
MIEATSTVAPESAAVIADARRERARFKSPLLALAVSFASGIVAARYAHLPVSIHWILFASVACVLAGLLMLRTNRWRPAMCFVLASMVLTGFAATRRWEGRFPPNHVRYIQFPGAHLNDPVRLEGRVISTPYRTGHDLQFDVDARRVELLGRIYAVVGKVRLRVQAREDRDATGGGTPAEILYGDMIRAVVQLRRPRVYQNPGGFDYRRWMEDIEDIYWVGAARSLPSVDRLGHTRSAGELAARVRQRLLRAIDDLYPPWSVQGRYGAVLKAILWGDRTALDSETIDDFRKTGLYHLLVIAGLHVGLLTLLVEVLLRGLRCRGLTRSYLVLAFLVVYAFLVEQRAPTLRATLMIGLYLLARILGRDHSPLNAIGGVALVLLYLRPAWLFETGFQLSFSAALLIVGVAVPILNRTTEPYRRALLRLDDVLFDDRFSPRLAQARLDLRAMVSALRRSAGFFDRYPSVSRNAVVVPFRALVGVAGLLIFSCVLQLGLLLPMVETFHRVTFAGVGLNALAIPLMTILLALALPTNLVSVFSPAAGAIPARLLTLVMAALFRLTHSPGLTDWLSYRMPSPPAWLAWAFCAAFMAAGVALRLSRRAAFAALAACGVLVVLIASQPFAPRLPHGALQITALDCGEGDAIVLVFRDGSTMLLDGGGSRISTGSLPSGRWNAGEDIVSPYLWSLGLKKLDVVALTHARPDQFEPLSAIVANFRVGEFWHAPQAESPEYASFLEILARRRIPTRTVMAGDTLAIGGAAIRILWPGPDPALPDFAQVHRPLVMRISADTMNFLLPGDADSEVEKTVLASKETLQSQVLTAKLRQAYPNPAFVARVDPSVVIISSGGEADNLPNMHQGDGFEGTRARVFRTDIDGATTASWNGKSLVVQTFRGLTAR